MIYEAERGELSLALTGETLMCRRFSMFKEPNFLALIDVLRDADVTFTNFEGIVQDWSDPPNTFAGGGAPGGTYMVTPPECLEDLKWAGFNLLSTANNHSPDFGEQGYLSNMRYLKAAGLTQAGSGANLTEATAAAYLDTAKGRVAMIAASDWGPRGAGDVPWPFPMGVIAGEQSPYSRGRPGINLIRHRVEITVPKESFEALQKLSQGMGWTAAKDSRRKLSAGWDKPATSVRMIEAVDSETEFHFMGTKFILGDTYKLITVAEPEDVKRNLKWVRDARRMADWVIVSYHNHGASPSPTESPVHSGIYAREAIDAGADMYVGHGTGRDRGIEIYKGKPIFHGLGIFVYQNDQVPWVPYENMERFGLGHDNTPADFFDARSGGGTKVHHVTSEMWESAVMQVDYDQHELRRIRIRPVELGMTLPRHLRGRPVLAEVGGEAHRRVIDRFRAASEKYGTEISPDGEIRIAG